MKIDVYKTKDLWKFWLFLCAVGIGALTLIYTETFLKRLRQEEEKRLQLWAEAINTINQSPDDAELNLASLIIEANTTIPIIMTDMAGRIIGHRNLDETRSQDSLYLFEQLQTMKSENEPIKIDFDLDQTNYLYFRNSILLRQLRIYPMVLLGVIGLLVTVAYLAFSSSRRSEQNRVWSGMAKETAHQIGTPLSSLLGWLHLLREAKTDPDILEEMDKDIERLQLITDRFSKIGSTPEMKMTELVPVVERSLSYLRKRTSQKIQIHFMADSELEHRHLLLNAPLFEWVIENLVRNSIDALEGHGEIWVEVKPAANQGIKVLVRDNGKGMSSQVARKIFRPGFTTKTRGWGLGLSLAKRIVEDYHHGSLSILETEPGKGTSMQIKLQMRKP